MAEHCKWTHHSTDDPRRFSDAISWHTITCKDNFLTRFNPREIIYCPYCGDEIDSKQPIIEFGERAGKVDSTKWI